jgi:hypothetical protein
LRQGSDPVAQRDTPTKPLNLVFQDYETAWQVAITVANGGRTDIGQNAQNDVHDPEHHFTQITCCDARKSFAVMHNGDYASLAIHRWRPAQSQLLAPRKSSNAFSDQTFGACCANAIRGKNRTQ